jgi:flagellin
VLSINTNSGALLAANAAKNAQKQMNEAMTRLSTGKRINSAKDDPGSLSVAIRMTAEISGLSLSYVTQMMLSQLVIHLKLH